MFDRKPTDATAYDPDAMFLQDDAWAEAMLTRVLILAGLVMLIGPLWILNFVDGINQRLGVITAFVVLFLLFLATVTAARTFEALAAAAGFADLFAILLVLILYL